MDPSRQVTRRQQLRTDIDHMAHWLCSTIQFDHESFICLSLLPDSAKHSHIIKNKNNNSNIRQYIDRNHTMFLTSVLIFTTFSAFTTKSGKAFEISIIICGENILWLLRREPSFCSLDWHPPKIHYPWINNFSSLGGKAMYHRILQCRRGPLVHRICTDAWNALACPPNPTCQHSAHSLECYGVPSTHPDTF